MGEGTSHLSHVAGFPLSIWHETSPAEPFDYDDSGRVGRKGGAEGVVNTMRAPGMVLNEWVVCGGIYAVSSAWNMFSA